MITNKTMCLNNDTLETFKYKKHTLNTISDV